MADKENVKSETISVVVRDQTGAEVHFKVKEHTRFNKVFDAYCKKKSMPANSVRFMFDGNRIQPDNTPAEVCIHLPT